jgi:hypothetical protein
VRLIVSVKRVNCASVASEYLSTHLHACIPDPHVGGLYPQMSHTVHPYPECEARKLCLCCVKVLAKLLTCRPSAPPERGDMSPISLPIGESHCVPLP